MTAVRNQVTSELEWTQGRRIDELEMMVYIKRRWWHYAFETNELECITGSSKFQFTLPTTPTSTSPPQLLSTCTIVTTSTSFSPCLCAVVVATVSRLVVFRRRSSVAP